MLAVPKSLHTLSLGQFSLAFFFLAWLLFLPDGGPTFAWPVLPHLTAVFIGTSFLLRTLMGVTIFRTKDWYRLRWVVWGNYTFLAVILVSTFWHAHEMNWQSNILLAHVWVLIYIFEPLILPFLGPYGAEANAPVPPELSEGPIMEGLRRVLIGVFMLTTTVAGLLFINPEFIGSRWPWPLDPFDARIMAAWPAGVAVWCATMAFAKDWAEIKPGIMAMAVYGAALFVAWVLTLSQYDMTRHNVWTYGAITASGAVVFAYYYWRQERQRTVQPSAAEALLQQGA